MLLVLVQVLLALVLVLRCWYWFWCAAAAECCHLMLVLAAGRWAAGRAAAGRVDVGRGYSPGRWRGMARLPPPRLPPHHPLPPAGSGSIAVLPP